MAPPHQDTRKRHSHLKHKGADEHELIPCPKEHCTGVFTHEAKFCIICGEKRPKKPKSPDKAKKVSEVVQDCRSTSGCRHTTWLFLHTEVRDTPFILRYAERYELFSICLVLYLVLSDIIVSIPEIKKMTEHSNIFKDVERFIYAVFTIEYVMRLWSCMESKTLSEMGCIRGRLKLMRGVIEMVDLIVLVAFYVCFLPGFKNMKGLQALRMVRLLRVVALLKVERKTSSFSSIVKVLKTKNNELVATVCTALVLMLMSATTVYYLETEAQPDSFPSVPASMWWAVISLTTVGYGDVVPITVGGKILGCVVAFFGVGLFALPAGILGSGFVEEVNRAKELAAQDSDEDEAGEIVDEQEETTGKIEDMTDDAKELRTRIDEMQTNQREIVNMLNTICPSLDIPMPVVKLRQHETKPGTDKDLAALQDSVILKLDTMRSTRSSDNLQKR